MPDETKTVVTERTEMTTDKELASVTIVSMPPWKIVLVRASRVYLQAILTFLTANGTGATAKVGEVIGLAIPVMDFYQVLLMSASMAVAPAVGSILQNTIELLAKLDATNPALRA
jgi:hypothetical protein